jgi:predicted nucleic acid-binding protein
MILDSSFLFDLMAEDDDAFQKGVQMTEAGETQWIPTPVLAETYYGAATLESKTNASDVQNALLAYPRVEIDEATAQRSGELLANADDAHGGASAVGWHDADIAAVADRLNDRVLTDNVADFEKLGAPVETY